MASFSSVPVFTPGTGVTEIPQNGSLTLPAGDYGKLLARKGSTVTFIGGEYNFV